VVRAEKLALADENDGYATRSADYTPICRFNDSDVTSLRIAIQEEDGNSRDMARRKSLSALTKT
jgi:hypothetical protein